MLGIRVCVCVKKTIRTNNSKENKKKNSDTDVCLMRARPGGRAPHRAASVCMHFPRDHHTSYDILSRLTARRSLLHVKKKKSKFLHRETKNDLFKYSFSNRYIIRRIIENTKKNYSLFDCKCKYLQIRRVHSPLQKKITYIH